MKASILYPKIYLKEFIFPSKAYKSKLIKCADLFINRVDLSEMCCMHLADVLAELLNFSIRPM